MRRTLVLACTTGIVACGADQGVGVLPVPEQPGPVVVAVRIAQERLDLAVPGDTATLSADALDGRGLPVAGRRITWASSDLTRVTVDGAGKVTAVALGVAEVSANVDGVSDSVEVHVDPVHAVARNCSPCHVQLQGAHAALLLPMGSCWTCHALADGGHVPPQRRHMEASGGFALVGVHDSASCAGCHSDGHDGVDLSPADPEDCLACHGEEYDRAHRGAGYPTTCGMCHTPTAWSDRYFDHGAASGGFDLLWAHAGSRCIACHLPESLALRFDPSNEEDCYACHQVRYEVRHEGDGYPTRCLICHNPEKWGGALAPHAPQSGDFALVGIHETLECAVCHLVETFAPRFTPVGQGDCVACHGGDYDESHGGTCVPSNCVFCHAPTSWTEAEMDHAAVSNGFDLIGAHAFLPCRSCHSVATCAPSVPSSDEWDCIACHQAEYDAEHAESGFPPTCLSCHDGLAWEGAVFDHDAQYFPIYSGVHENRWTSRGCPTCHVDVDDFGVFTCFSCHRHGQTLTDAEHRGVEGYEYESSRCLFCHPRGTA